MEPSDCKLSDNFSLWEFLKTSHLDLQAENSQVTQEQIDKLKKVAGLMEHIRYVLGVPLTITSGYRCLKLNERVGSRPDSQHVKCEACDFIPKGLDLGEAFRKIKKDMEETGTNIGQLIFENNGKTSWCHVSLGEPFREKSLCRQTLQASMGKDGKMVYTTV